MDGGSAEPGGWRSSIPGVHQRADAPASLGLTGRGVASGQGDVWGRGHDAGSPTAPSAGGQSAGRRRRRAGPWRALGLGVLALVAIVGVARAAEPSMGPSTGPRPAVVPTARASAADPAAVATRGTPAAGAGTPTASGEAVPAGPEAASSSAHASTASVGGGGQEPDWWTVMAELDRRRTLALGEVDAGLLSSYAVPGSPAWEADSSLLADLSGRGLRPQALTSTIVAIERVDRQGTEALARVVDRRSSYSLVDSSGAVAQVVPASGPVRWEVTLRRGEARDGDPGWRVAGVVQVPSAQASEAASPTMAGDAPHDASPASGDASAQGAP